MKTKVSILLSIAFLLMLVLKPQDVAAQRKKAGQEGSVKRNSYLQNKIHPTAAALDSACLGGKYEYIVSGFYESIFQVILIDPTTGKVTDTGSRYDSDGGTVTNYKEEIQWLKGGTHEIGVIETSMPDGKVGCVSDTVFYKVAVQSLSLFTDNKDKYFCFGDTLSIESKGNGASPFDVSWYSSSTGSINDTAFIAQGNTPRISKVVQSGNYWVVSRDAIGCQSWSDLHVKDRPQIGFSYMNTSGNFDNRLANDSIKFHASTDVGTLTVSSDLVADKTTWSSLTPGISADLQDKLANNNEMFNLNLAYSDVIAPQEFKLQVAVSNKIQEVESVEKYCTTADTLLIYRVSSNITVTGMHGNFIMPTANGSNAIYNEWDLSQVVTYVDPLSGKQEYTKMLVIIYDRWGRMVWQSTPGYTENFKGVTNSGTELPADSYHYVIKKNDGSIGDIGNVTVIR